LNLPGCFRGLVTSLLSESLFSRTRRLRHRLAETRFVLAGFLLDTVRHGLARLKLDPVSLVEPVLVGVACNGFEPASPWAYQDAQSTSDLLRPVPL